METHIAAIAQPALSSSKLPLIFIGLLLILSAGVGGVYLGNYLYGPKTSAAHVAPIVVPTAIPTTDLIADWKTYTSKDNKYVFMYPQSWKLMNKDDYGLDSDSEFQVCETKVLKVSNRLSGLPGSKISDNANMAVNGLKIKKDLSGMTEIYVPESRIGELVYINIYPSCQTDDTNKKDLLLDQILSTFHFLK